MKNQYSPVLRTLLTTVACCLLYGVQAQQYTFSPSVHVFVPLSEQPNTNAVALDQIEDDDVISNAIDIGFMFNFFGQDYDQLKVSSNGFITFNLLQEDQLDNEVGTNSFISHIIAPLWDDISGEEGQASYAVTGIEPNRIFSVEWINWRWRFNSSSAISFQVTLHEGSNEIRFNYRQEIGTLVLPSASIAVIGNNPEQFVSLQYDGVTTHASGPVYAPAGFNKIAHKPQTGQRYTFEQSDIVPVAPTVAATNIVANATTGTTMNIQWVNGDGAYRAVFMRQTSEVSGFTPQNNAFYTPSASWQGGFSDAGNGWFCIYNGAGSSVDVTNLQSGFPYRIHVCEYNGLAQQQQYFPEISVFNPISVTTPVDPPAEPLSTLRLNYVSSNTVRFALEEGNGAGRAIFMREGSDGLAPAADEVSYSASTTFGLGSQIGSSGWFCVFNGTNASDIIINGLQANTAYKVHVVDYNGVPGEEVYNTSSLDAAETFITFSDVPATYELHSLPGVFTPIVGGEQIPSIQFDDRLSPEKIPIGFTFYFDGTPFNELTPSSNGFVSFNPHIQNSLTAFNNNSLEASFARPLIAPLWDDVSGETGVASYLTTGIAPNRIFTIEFLNWRWNFNADVNISFQIKLYEADNAIEYIYREEAGDVLPDGASIGLAFQDIGDYASLDGSGENPQMLFDSENSDIDVKPVTGQVYRFTPNKLDQTITFNPFSPVTFANPKPTIQLEAFSTSGLPIVYQPGDPAIATITGTTLTIHKAGETIITASQSGNLAFNSAATVDQLLTVTIGDQTINFPEIPPKHFGDAEFQLDASATSGLELTYESLNTSVATIDGNVVSVIGVGSTEITARQPGNENFHAASDVTRTLTIEKGSQEITFNPLPVKMVGDAPFQISATSSVDLPVSFGSSNTAVATVDGNIVTILNYGSTTITASQAGTGEYNAATPIAQTLLIRSTQVIDFPEISGKTLGDQDFPVSPTSTSGLSVQLSTTSVNITLNDGTVSLLAPGRATILADQPGDNIFLAASPVERTFCVFAQKPEITLEGLGSETPVLSSSATSHNQWFKDGAAILGETNPTLAATSAGSYTVKVIVDDCESEPSDPESLIVTGVGVEQRPVTIYPNPARDEITVDVRGLHLQTEVPVTIIDINGQQVIESSVRSSVHIDISKLAPGAYLVRIAKGEGYLSNEFVKN